MIDILTQKAHLIGSGILGVGVLILSGAAIVTSQQIQHLKKAVYEKPAVIVVTPSASPSAVLSPTEAPKVFRYYPVPSKVLIK